MRRVSVLKYDIDITDEEGRVVVGLKEFMVRAILNVSKEEKDYISNDISMMLHQLVRKLKNGNLSVDQAYKIIEKI